jgi:hypothetical protein
MFNRVWLRDTAERSIATFAQTFLALLLAGSLADVATIQAAAVAGLASALSVIKSALAARIPGTVSPASVAVS